jgi:hypothetical protein
MGILSGYTIRLALRSGHVPHHATSQVSSRHVLHGCPVAETAHPHSRHGRAQAKRRASVMAEPCERMDASRRPPTTGLHRYGFAMWINLLNRPISRAKPSSSMLVVGGRLLRGSWRSHANAWTRNRCACAPRRGHDDNWGTARNSGISQLNNSASCQTPKKLFSFAQKVLPPAALS